MIDKILEGYNHKSIRAAAMIFGTLKNAGIDPSELADFQVESREQMLKDANSISPVMGRRRARKKARAAGNKRKAVPPFMVPGEGEVLNGARCACGGDLYSEALCGKTSVKEKCIRIAICVECNSEVKIR